MFDFTDTGSCPHRLFSSACKEWGERAKGHDVLYPIFCLKIEKEPQKLSLWNKQATVARKPKCFPTVHHHIRILPREAPSHAISQLPTEMAGQWGEEICTKCSLWIKKGHLNCSSLYHVSFVSFLVLIRIFMAKAARTLLAAHEAVFLLWRVNMSSAHLTAD